MIPAITGVRRVKSVNCQTGRYLNPTSSSQNAITLIRPARIRNVIPVFEERNLNCKPLSKRMLRTRDTAKRKSIEIAMAVKGGIFSLPFLKRGYKMAYENVERNAIKYPMLFFIMRCFEFSR